MVLPNWVTGGDGETAWSLDVDKRHRECRAAKANSLIDWLEKRGYRRNTYEIPHKGQTVLSAREPDKEYPYHWCFCKSEIWVCKECKCKNWEIINLPECKDTPMWILVKEHKYSAIMDGK